MYIIYMYVCLCVCVYIYIDIHKTSTLHSFRTACKMQKKNIKQVKNIKPKLAVTLYV